MSSLDSIQNQIQNRQTMGNRTSQKPPLAAASRSTNWQPQSETHKNTAPRSKTASGKPSRKKKPRIRYDRILLVLLIIIGLIVLLTIGIKQCGKSGDSNSTQVAKTTTTTAVSTSIPEQTLALTAEDVNKGDLILVNADHVYTFAADDVTLETVYEGRNSCYGVSDLEVSLDATVIEQFNQLMQAYYDIYENQDIMVAGGYRTRETQAEFYENKKTMLPGGYSDYHTARSFDLIIYPDGTSSNYYAATGDYAWIAEHAAEYGFILRYPDGKADKTGISPRAYTFRYVGLPHSTYIYENDLCLEEYLEQIQNYAKDNPLTIDTGNGVWNVFYVAANATGSTQIAVPKDATYTVSGDNIGGFIVAYQESGTTATTTTDSETDITDDGVTEEESSELEETTMAE